MAAPISRAGAMFLAAGALTVAGRQAYRRSREEDISGSVALVTGGSRGLGFLIAQELVRQGCRVVICARDLRQLEAARRRLERPGAPVLTIPCDVGDQAQVDALLSTIEADFGPIDLLVNNASIIQVGPLEEMNLEDFHHAMEVNFWGTVIPTLAVLPSMLRRRSGRIVNITSIGGKVSIPHLLPYSAAKFATVGFSEGLTAELAAEGISVTTVVPGLMRTGSPVNAFFKGDAAREFAWFSLGDATPVSAMNARRAARQIVAATRRRAITVTLTWQAKLLRLAHDLLPGPTMQLLSLVDRVLPEGDGESGQVRGMQLATSVSPSPATAMMNRAARENNQYGGRPSPSARHARQVGLRSPRHSPESAGGEDARE